MGGEVITFEDFVSYYTGSWQDWGRGRGGGGGGEGGKEGNCILRFYQLAHENIEELGQGAGVCVCVCVRESETERERERERESV